MKTAKTMSNPGFPEDLESRWEQAIEYFRSRKGVLFYSDCRFWEKHNFVQQSLAKELVREGVEVIWLDGAGWRPYRPTLYWRSPQLKVQQLFQLPFVRFESIRNRSEQMQREAVADALRKLGDNPVTWVESGMPEYLVEGLPQVDVYSVFDDPYRISTDSKLFQEAKVVTCQNSHARDLLAASLGEKVKFQLPPMEMSDAVFKKQGRIKLPDGFPDKVAGYVGSLAPEGFDYTLFENFLSSFPEWGFVLAGRILGDTKKHVNRFRKYKNFYYHPWVPRSDLAPIWEVLDLSLLFYRQLRTQEGAFAVKSLESLFFGVPCIATDVPKTRDLGICAPRGATIESLRKLAPAAMDTSEETLRHFYKYFALEMHPKVHLLKTAEWLQGQPTPQAKAPDTIQEAG